MLEALILWQIVNDQSNKRQDRYPPGQESYEFFFMVFSMLTILFWVVPAGAKLGLRKHGDWVFGLYLVPALFMSFILLPFSILVGIGWLTYEISVYKREIERLEEEESEVMYEVRYVTPSPNRKES